MPTKTITDDAKIKPIPNSRGYNIGYTCPKCGCDDWFKAAPAIQKTTGVGRTKYGCRMCKIDKKASYRAENPHVLRAANARYYAENPHVRRAANARYRAENPHIKRAADAKRRATKLNATPHWLTEKDIAEIKRVYEDCPSGYQVDHILPLQGKHMCGLHVPRNLKAIPASENASKCNREPDWTKTFQPGLHP